MSQHGWILTLVFGALGVGVLGGSVVAGVAVGDDCGVLRNEAPGPKWSFDSWATNITAVGAGLATVLAAATLPQAPHPLNKEAFVGLSLLFGLLVLTGPFLFQCIRNPRKSPTDPDVELWGWNITLLLACELTLAAVVGEIATLGLLYWEILDAGFWGWTAIAVASAVGVIVVYYFSVTVWYLVRADWKKVADDASAANRNAVAQAFAVAPNAVAVVPSARSRLNWKLP